MSVRYVRDEEFFATALRRVGGGLRDVQRATGTERLQTSETAVAAWDQSVFAKDLAEQLEGELGPLPGQIQEALGESAAALAEAGLARSDAATAVSDAQAAVAEAEQAILDAAAASGAASVADGKAAAAQVVAQSALADAEVALARAGVSEVFIQGVAPRANYAPSLYGPTVPVEVRRNLCTNPIPTGNSSLTGWSRRSAGTSDLPTLVGDYISVSNVTDRGGIYQIGAVTTGGVTTFSATVLATNGLGVRVGLYNFTAGEWLIPVDSGGATFVSDGTPTRVSVTQSGGYTIGDTLRVYYVRSDGVSGSGVSLAVRHQLAEASPVLGDYFDGTTAPDPDMTARWLGTPNASESVLEGQHPVGFTDVRCVSIIHEVGDGTRELRQIPSESTVVGGSTASVFSIPAAARGGGTLLATVSNPDGDNTGPSNRYTTRVTSPITDTPSTPSGGTHRNVFGALLSNYSAILYGGSPIQGSGEAHWSKIGLYAGDYDGPNLVMENILWIDTTGGANTPKRWSGSAWAAITDKVAVDAAAAAVAAQTKADSAFDEAVDAATAAGNAQTSANGKNRVWYQGTAPAGTGHKPGDTWFDTSNGNRVTQWDGDSWEATQFGTGAIATAAITNALIADATIQNAKIANLDAAKITTGTLDAARIAALAITTGHLAANAVTAAKIAALTITAAEIASNAVTALKIAANAVTAEKINAGAVTTVKLDALAVTAEKIAVGAIIAEKIAAETITTAKLAADAIDGMTITGALIRTAPSGQRMQFDVNGLRAINASGVETARLLTGTGGFELDGQLTVNDSWIYSRSSLRSTSMSPGGFGSLESDNSASAGGGTTAGEAHLGAQYRSGATSDAFMFADANGGALHLAAKPSGGIEKYLKIETSPTQPTKMLFNDVLEVGNNSSQVTKFRSSVEFQGDTDWVPLTPATGWTSTAQDGYPALSIKRRNGMVELRGIVQRGSWSANTLVATLPVGFRPLHNTDGVYRHTGVNVGALQIFANGSINAFSAGTAFGILAGVWMVG